MGHYPFEWQAQDLCAEDFKHFQNQFSQTILQLIPFADGPVTFLDSTIDPVRGLARIKQTQILATLYQTGIKTAAFYSWLLKNLSCFLPVWGAESIIGIAAVEGVDAQFAEVLSEEWLSDRSRIISREFSLQKQLAFDPVTGMFNGRHLQDTLDGLFCMVPGKYRTWWQGSYSAASIPFFD